MPKSMVRGSCKQNVCKNIALKYGPGVRSYQTHEQLFFSYFFVFHCFKHGFGTRPASKYCVCHSFWCFVLWTFSDMMYRSVFQGELKWLCSKVMLADVFQKRSLYPFCLPHCLPLCLLVLCEILSRHGCGLVSHLVSRFVFHFVSHFVSECSVRSCHVMT